MHFSLGFRTLGSKDLLTALKKPGKHAWISRHFWPFV
jgi:hypothetical protein